LPSFIIILLVAKFYLAFKNSRVVKGCMTGLRPATVGLIGSAVLTIGQTVFFSDGFSVSMFVTPAFLCSAALCVVATMMGFKKVHPILIITLSAAVGIGLGYLGVWG
jgi:chromate transporter